MSAAWKLHVPFSGEVYLVDRESGEQVGYALQDFHGRWESFCVCARGRVLGVHHFRTDALDAIKAHRESGCASDSPKDGKRA